MSAFQAVVLCTLITTSLAKDLWSFPPNLKFGAASASYQVEGGWKDDGKGENIWDKYVHDHSGLIKGGVTGDIAADSYHRWRDDVKVAAKMKLQFYRFSINWPRILPTGFTNKINQAGVDYYSDLIDGLLAEGIEPIVTMYHWELPVAIQDLGGWANPLIVEWFGDFARVIFKIYAERVRTWLTFNEPVAFCDYGYNSGMYAPGVQEQIYGPYLCNKHVLLAHAKAYRIFHKEFRPRYTGKISLANNVLWIEPLDLSYSSLAELGRQHQTGRYSHPIFSKEGGWPPSIEKLMEEYSLKQGFKESRLPKFTRHEIEFIKGTADFYGLNYYTTNMIRPAIPGDKPGIWFLNGSPELNATLLKPKGAYYGHDDLLPVKPEGLRKELNWLKEQYGDIDFFITENGYSTTAYNLADYERVKYMRDHLEQMLLSIKEDKVSVVGYAAWSLVDNFEWLGGYSTKFGLYEIDYEHPNRTRTARASAHYYRCVIEKRSLDVPKSCYVKNYTHNRTRRTDNLAPNRGISTQCTIVLNILVLAVGFILSTIITIN
ncbi:myrosinase 1 [Bicyclus anynana]|uniref:Myrosinase 1 n=1 Tax=Bicyclus anynana TaxID=110368 RepID=A0ABM3LVZ2_BICAN|nr:myrosinase 1 [Bicyclus anynana]